MGAVKRALLATADAVGLIRLLESLERWPPDTVKVLTYHRVEWPGGRDYLDPALISASPLAFAAQMRLLASRFRVVSLAHLIAAVRGGERLPPRSVLLTFDDGYRDFAENAWPVLKALGLPVTLFVSTAYPGDESRLFWWDALYQILTQASITGVSVDGIGYLRLDDERSRRRAFAAAKKLMNSLPAARRGSLLAHLQEQCGVEPRRGDALLSWHELKELAADGVCVAPHTHTHPILGVEDRSRVVSEVVQSRQLVRDKVGQDWPAFCYPNGQPGSFNAMTGRVLREAGYVVAFTTVWGSNSLGRMDPLAMRRIGVGRHMSSAHLRLQMTGHYERARRRYGRA